jgi:hypothetical protein
VSPLLTLAVPTFERAPRLRRLLDTLVAELAPVVGEVDVLVADNASTDDTSAVLAAAGDRLPLRVIRRPENVGPLETVRLLCQEVETDFVWFFGDDDTPLPGAFRTVLELVRREKPVWLHLPHQWVREDGVVVGGSPCPPEPQRLGGSGALFRGYHHWLTFLSAAVLRTADVAAAARAHQTENRYAPFVWFYRAARGGPCLVADRPLVAGPTETGWADVRATIMTEHFVGLYDECVGLDLSPHEFGLLLDELYAAPDFLAMWREAPDGALARTVERFPTSRSLRWYLWMIARQERRHDLVGTVAAAQAAAGVEARALELVAQGEAAFADGRKQEALATFEEAGMLAPATATAWTDVGVVRHELGLPGALDAFDAALAAAPDDVEALVNRAYVLRASGEAERAAVDAERALALAPGNPTVQALAGALGLR